MMERRTHTLFFLALFGASLFTGLASASETVVAATILSPTHTETEIVAMAAESTEFRTDRRYRNRAHNVELAAKLLEGALIQPGETLSFNDTVGERSAERGFLNAPVIANGRIRQGLGGGVCQVSTTLHLAALSSGLEIVEHRTHSRVSSYAAAGLDATVSWGTIDYKVSNPYDFPVRVRAHAADGVMNVALEGARAHTFEIETRQLRSLPIRERVVEDTSLAIGERVVESAGRTGSVVRVTRVDADGNREVFRLRYRSAPRVVRVGAVSVTPAAVAPATTVAAATLAPTA